MSDERQTRGARVTGDGRNRRGDRCGYGHRRRPRRGRAAAAADPQGAGRDPRGPVRGDRHLREHAVAAGVRAAQAQPGAAAADRPRPPGAARRTGRGAAGRRSRGSAPKPIVRHGRTYWPLTRQPGGLQAFKVLEPVRRMEPEPRTHEGYEWLYVLSGRLRLVLGEHDVVLGRGGGRGVRHPCAALVRVDRRGARGVPEPVRAAGGADARHGRGPRRGGRVTDRATVPRSASDRLVCGRSRGT